MQRIYLSGKFPNKYALVDDEDFLEVSKHIWHYTNHGYAETKIDNKNIRLHRFIMNPSKEKSVDHINFNGLDCRKDNLRICTHRENMYYRRKHCDNTSGYKGVHWDNINKKWYVSIQKDGNKKFGGRYININDAVNAYNIRAKEMFGQFAQLN